MSYPHPTMNADELTCKSDTKMISFLADHLSWHEGSTEEVPGIAKATSTKLAAVGITSAGQLFGQFCLLNRNVADMVGWLEESKLCQSGFTESIVKALALKAHDLLDA